MSHRASRAASAVLGLLLVAAATAHRARPAHGESAVQSEHVLVEGDVPLAWAEEAASLVEALWPRLVETFGDEPPRADLPLRVRLFSDKEGFRKASREAGADEDLSATGGWTSFDAPTSFVALQPEPFDTRRLVLHEAVHQFQARLVGRSARREPRWHHEGLAEWFGWHRRTASGVVFGAMDAVALRHRPWAVARRMAARGLDASAILSGRAEADYTDALGLVAALRSAEDPGLRAHYAAWSRHAMWGRAGSLRSANPFAGREDAIDSTLRAAWDGFAPPWLPDGPGWDEEPEGLVFSGEGEGTLLGQVPVPGAVPRIRAVVRLEASAEAALAVGDPTCDEWVVGSVGRGGVRLRVCSGGTEEVVARAERPPGEGPLALLVGRDGDVAFLVVDAGGRVSRLVPDAARAPLSAWSEVRGRLRAEGGGPEGRAVYSAVRLGE